MQKRHSDSFLYFTELANTSRAYYLDYLSRFTSLDKENAVLEIGCGQGGNLLPFVEAGCRVKGVDISAGKIDDARKYFASFGDQATFVCADFFQMDTTEKYDVVLVHDVIEHIEDKTVFINRALQFVKEDGVIFWRFPAWQMPFGGHQQICKNRMISSFPFIHLLPKKLYALILKSIGENPGTIRELLSVKDCATTIERFEKEMKTCKLGIVDRTLWFINPHYEQKFKLKPRLLYGFLGKMKYVRNFFCTSCYYLTKIEKV